MTAQPVPVQTAVVPSSGEAPSNAAPQSKKIALKDFIKTIPILPDRIAIECKTYISYLLGRALITYLNTTDLFEELKRRPLESEGSNI